MAQVSPFTSLATIWACRCAGSRARSWPLQRHQPLCPHMMLQHSNRWDPNSLSNVEYGDDTSIMGGGGIGA